MKRFRSRSPNRGGGGGGNGGDNKRRRRSSKDIEMRILVPSTTAGAIIGRRGDTIRRLRSEYTVTVNLPDSPTPERILLVAGEQEQVLNCVKECLAILRDSKENQSAKDRSRDRRGRSRSREREPPEGDLRIVVHTAVAGAFIGRGGEEVKKTRAEVRCKVQVNGDCCPNSTERIIQLAGAIDDCIEGAKRVLAVCQATVIKGPIRPYDPGFYDPTNISEYGGYPPDGAGPGPRGPPGGRGGGRFGGPPPFRGGGSGGGFGDRGPPAFGDRGGFRDDRGPPAAGRFGGGGGALPFGGGGGGGGGRGFSDARAGDFGAPPGGRGFSDNSRSDFRAAPMRGGGGGASMLMGPGGDTGGMAPPFGGGGGMGGGGGGGAPPAFVPQGGGGGISTQQVTIPDELAGTVIGKGGSEINRVREQSHARIEVDRTQARGRDRIITISGTPSQIQMAQYLLQQCVRSSQAGRAYIESRR